MQQVIMTTLTKDDLETVIIDCLKAFHRYNDLAPQVQAHEQRHAVNKPQRASRNHAQNDHSNNTQKQAA